MANRKTILIAPLNWGLGHASRCIPIIQALLSQSYEVIIASDGAALFLLRKEFPDLTYIELPSYDIKYPEKGYLFKWNLLLKLPHIQKTIGSEKKMISKLVSEGRINGIISDNRWGIHCKCLPSVFITHQLNVLSGTTTAISSKIHQSMIRKFDECWVPDKEDSENLSGILGHPKQSSLKKKYIGLLSRMTRQPTRKVYDISIILSGPEPQRTLFEEKILAQLSKTTKKILIVQGIIEREQQYSQFHNLTLVNYMTHQELEKSINESELVISRSGYSSIMDMAVMKKRAFFIPTPGQYEQEYLAKRLERLGIAGCCKQKDFSEQQLKVALNYNGFEHEVQKVEFEKLFRLFECE